MTSEPQALPKHIAIIMDGNRRWARQNKLKALQGHAYVTDHVIEPLVDRCIELGIPYLTLWAFSTENWHRDKEEVMGLMQLFRKAFQKQAEDLHKKGVRLRIIGDIDAFPEDIAKQAKEWVRVSQENTKITVSFALNYGGRQEIVQATEKLLCEKFSILNSQFSTNDQLKNDAMKITPAEIEGNLYTVGMPDPDLLIRPGGELRLSGFLPWQTVYTELYFTDVLMPDFSPAELDTAIAEYQKRQRRFGK